MTASMKPSPSEIRVAREENPKMRERDLAASLGISEAEFVAAWCGEGVRRIDADIGRLFAGVTALGEVMALTRNESAVHEKIGVYERPIVGERAAMVLGPDIDLRVFPRVWAHGFAVERRDGDNVRRSLQFFDAAGDAVHKIHLRPASDLDAYEGLVASLLSPDQDPTVATLSAAASEVGTGSVVDLDDLRQRWGRMTDVHQFIGILRDLNLSRRRAVELVGEKFAWRIENDAVAMMMHRAAEIELPIMCFVGNRGCIQIHSGPISQIKPMGPWLNVMDPTFHLHLRLDHITDVWAVRKPNSDGHVTSIEAYGADGSLIIQFFGKREEGTDERPQWRALVECFQPLPQSTAA